LATATETRRAGFFSSSALIHPALTAPFSRGPGQVGPFRPRNFAVPRLPKFGHWHTHEFTAAGAPAHQIVVANNQKAETDEFLRAAVDVAIKILS
jgi:hypothetical protein